MSNYYVTLTIHYIWQFKKHPHIKVTRCGMVINNRTGNLLKYNQRGFYIEGIYYKRKDIKYMVEKPKKKYCPF